MQGTSVKLTDNVSFTPASTTFYIRINNPLGSNSAILFAVKIYYRSTTNKDVVEDYYGASVNSWGTTPKKPGLFYQYANYFIC